MYRDMEDIDAPIRPETLDARSGQQELSNAQSRLRQVSDLLHDAIYHAQMTMGNSPLVKMLRTAYKQTEYANINIKNGGDAYFNAWYSGTWESSNNLFKGLIAGASLDKPELAKTFADSGFFSKE